MTECRLPPGVSRHEDAGPEVTLDDCHALLFELATPLRFVIVWRGRPSNVRPLDRRKRIRDLRPGDNVTVFGRSDRIAGVQIYR